MSGAKYWNDPPESGPALKLDAAPSRNGFLPYDEDAEKGVLCSLILSPPDAGDLRSRQLKPEYFYAPPIGSFTKPCLNGRASTKSSSLG
jgi:hypothetical protein